MTQSRTLDPARKPPHARRVGVFVLGMHRSGTSATTRALNLLGLPTCIEADLISGLAGNAKGHFESGTLMRINGEFLAALGSHWWYPPPVGCDYSVVDSASRSRACAAFMAVHPADQWVCKDPRLCVTLPVWLGCLPVSPAIVAMTRNPLEVAKSLEQRDLMSPRQALAMWERYTRHMIVSMTGRPVFLSDFDDLLQDPAQWCATAVRFLRSVGTDLPSPDIGSVQRSLEPSLRHSRYTETDISVDADVYAGQSQLYRALRSATGVSMSFEPPRVPPECPAVERTFRAHNRRHRRVLRRLQLRKAGV